MTQPRLIKWLVTQVKKWKGHLRMPTKTEDTETLVFYRPGKEISINEERVILFANQDEVEQFKLEQEVKVLDAKIHEINQRLQPWEEEIRRKHRNLWGY